MARRTKEESLACRERLLDAALQVFHERGVSGPSLSDIAALAGVTRGAIYVHFENKGDLFSALLDRMVLPAATPVSWRPDGGTPLEQLRETVAFILRETAENPLWRSMFTVVFHKCEKHEENAAIVERLRQIRTAGRANMERLAREAVAAGELPEDLDVDAAIGLLHSSVVGTMSQWLLDQRALDLGAHAGAYADALIEMLKVAPTLRRV